VPRTNFITTHPRRRAKMAMRMVLRMSTEGDRQQKATPAKTKGKHPLQDGDPFCMVPDFARSAVTEPRRSTDCRFLGFYVFVLFFGCYLLSHRGGIGRIGKQAA